MSSMKTGKSVERSYLPAWTFAYTVLLLLAMAATVRGATVTASWNPNPETNIAGYKLSYGTQSHVYTTSVDVGNVTSRSLTLPGPQRYYFAVQAYNASGQTSSYSAEVFFDVPGAPPTLTSLSPAVGPVGIPVIIAGANFGASQGASTVNFNGTLATPTSWSATSIMVPVPLGATTGTVVVTVGGAASNGLQFTVSVPKLTTVSDFDGDKKTDLAMYQGSGMWSILLSGTAYSTSLTIPFGLNTDIPVPGDYDGDGKTDIAVFRPSTGVWYVLPSSTGFTTPLSYTWGTNGDRPFAADFDGDGKADLAVFRPSNGTWYVLLSSANFTTYMSVQWGLGTDTAIVADFDGDARADLAVFRPSNGTWNILQSRTNFTTYVTYAWGTNGDKPVAADFDGDGKADLAVFRPSTGMWLVLKSSSNYGAYFAIGWGLSTDVLVPGDYDGDNITDIAVFRPSTGGWYILKSSTNFSSYTTYTWETAATDRPVMQRP
jgi:hypothetical protein